MLGDTALRVGGDSTGERRHRQFSHCKVFYDLQPYGMGQGLHGATGDIDLFANRKRGGLFQTGINDGFLMWVHRVWTSAVMSERLLVLDEFQHVFG